MLGETMRMATFPCAVSGCRVDALSPPDEAMAQESGFRVVPFTGLHPPAGDTLGLCAPVSGRCAVRLSG